MKLPPLMASHPPATSALRSEFGEVGQSPGSPQGVVQHAQRIKRIAKGRSLIPPGYLSPSVSR